LGFYSGPAVLKDAATAREIRKIGDKESSFVAFSPDGKTLLISGGFKRAARLWDTETGASKGDLATDFGRETSGGNHFAAFSQDSKKVATVGVGRPFVLWDVAERKELLRLPIYNASEMKFTPDGRTLAISEGSAIRFWNITAGKE